MNARGGWALMKSTWASWMQYRSFFFVLAFGWMIPPLTSLFVWMTAAGNGEIGGLNRAELSGYYLVLVLVNQLTYAQTNWTLGDVIREGSLSFWLLRPLSPFFHLLASEVAGKCVMMAFVLPAAVFLTFLLRPSFEIHAAQASMFLAALVLSWVLRFLWGCWIALLAFWATRADALLALQDALVFLLAGVAAPVALLPHWMQIMARFLPFRYMVGFPVEVLTGQLDAGALAFGFGVQAAWLVLAAALSLTLWRAGLLRYTAVGG